MVSYSDDLSPSMTMKTRKIAFVGLDQAGKTTTLARLSKGILIQTRPTLGFNNRTFTFMGVNFNVFDLGGHRNYHIFWEKFLSEQEAIVFFIDSANKRRLPEARLALNKTLALLNPGATVMILANKQDLPEAMAVPDLFNALDLTLVSTIKQLQIFPVSAITGMGIYDAFYWLTSSLNIDISEKQCTLYGFSIYEKDSLASIFSSNYTKNEKSLVDLSENILLLDPVLIRSLYAAIENFARDLTRGDLKSFSFKHSKSKKTFQITSISQNNFVCILITAEDDKEEIVSTLGEAILHIFQEKQKTGLCGRSLDELEMFNFIEILSPFIRNTEAFRRRFKSSKEGFISSILSFRPENVIEKDINISADFIEDELNLIESDSNSHNFQANSTSSEINNNVSSSFDIYLARKSPFQQVSDRKYQKGRISSPSSHQSSRNTEHETSNRSHVQKQQLNNFESSNRLSKMEKSTPPENDALFFQMGVAERIKFLQQKHKRLQE